MNINKPLVSVIVTSYNYEQYIGQTINSILNQSYQNWELIISDDCSKDKSVQIINSYSDPRIKLITSEQNEGGASAYNKAYRQCKGQYIFSLDSDDYLAPNAFKTQIEFFDKNPRVDILGTYLIEIDAEGKLLQGDYERWFNTEIDLNKATNWIWQNKLCHSSVMMRKSLHDKIGEFDEELIYTPDYDFWLKALAFGAKFHIIPEKLIYYRNHGGNITHKNTHRTFWEYVYTTYKVLNPYFLRLGSEEVYFKNLSVFLDHKLYQECSSILKSKLHNILVNSQNLQSIKFNEFYESITKENVELRDADDNLLDYVFKGITNLHTYIKDIEDNTRLQDEKLLVIEGSLKNYKNQVSIFVELNNEMHKRLSDLESINRQLENDLCESKQTLNQTEQKLEQTEQELKKTMVNLAQKSSLLDVTLLELDAIKKSRSYRLTNKIKKLLRIIYKV